MESSKGKRSGVVSPSCVGSLGTGDGGLGAVSIIALVGIQGTREESAAFATYGPRDDKVREGGREGRLIDDRAQQRAQIATRMSNKTVSSFLETLKRGYIRKHLSDLSN